MQLEQQRLPCRQCFAHSRYIYICECEEGRNEERWQNKTLQPPMTNFWKMTFASLSAFKICKCWNFSDLTPEVILIHKMHFKSNQLNTLHLPFLVKITLFFHLYQNRCFPTFVVFQACEHTHACVQHPPRTHTHTHTHTSLRRMVLSHICCISSL